MSGAEKDSYKTFAKIDSGMIFPHILEYNDAVECI